MIKLIVGLGNPGAEYENTYHNVGEGAVLYLAAHENLKASWRKHGDSFSYCKSENYIFIRSLVFMNESGVAARDAAQAFKIKPEEVVILHDDSDLPIGDFKYSFGGSSAGHKGVESVINHLHTTDFGRIRIGVRNPDERIRIKAGDFVLTHVHEAHRKRFETIYPEIAEKLSAIQMLSQKAESS